MKITFKKKDRRARPVVLGVPRIEQPDDVSCGPTCLAQIYRYYGYDRPLARVIDETPHNPDGGTLAVYLGLSALRNGFECDLYSYNLRVFDPTWRALTTTELVEKLEARRKAVKPERLRQAITGYVDFLMEGGRVHFAELRRDLLAEILSSGSPVLTGLNATYLYETPREQNNEYDDIRGDPVGHFVVISGYFPKIGRFVIRDPSTHIPFSQTGRYSVSWERLNSAILLGDITYDAVLLVVKPR